MKLGGATVGEVTAPSPNPSPDPFNPDLTIWPEAPGWLFPTVMVFAAIVVVAVIVLLVMWRKSVIYARQEKAAKGPTDWIDLSKLDKKGRWEADDGPDLQP